MAAAHADAGSRHVGSGKASGPLSSLRALVGLSCDWARCLYKLWRFGTALVVNAGEKSVTGCGLPLSPWPKLPSSLVAASAVAAPWQDVWVGAECVWNLGEPHISWETSWLAMV